MIGFSLLLCATSSIFSNGSLPALSCQGVFQGCQYLGNNFGVGVVSHHSDPPNLPSAGSMTSGDLDQVVLHGVATHRHEVNTLRYLDGVHRRQPGFWIWDKHLEAKLSKTGLQCVSSKSVSPPAVFETFLGDHGKTLPQPVHGVDRPGVVVDPALTLPAVPVLAQPVKVEVEGTRRFCARSESLHSPIGEGDGCSSRWDPKNLLAASVDHIDLQLVSM